MMNKTVLRALLIVFIITIVSCAKRGTINGGLKDTLAPELLNSLPKNESVNFTGNEIKLFFNEFVKLKNVNKQLIVSPPMDKQPEILPYNASKVITIKIKDTLKPNTTYSFNFGQSIEDNNEGNKFSEFKYVFSTGSFIDSLQLKVKIKDALEQKTPSFVKVMLYEINEKFNDSTIYKENPRYIANTLDSLKMVSLENLKEGKYLLVGIKDENNNNKFNPKTDKIGFQKEYISIPNDTVYELELFKETLPFKMFKPVQASGNRATMGYEGNVKNVSIKLSKNNQSIEHRISKLPKKDSIQIWFPSIKNDSIDVIASKDTYNEKFALKLKDQKVDSLYFSPSKSSVLSLNHNYEITSSIPIEKIDKTKINLITKDSVAVKFDTEYDSWEQKIVLKFDKNANEKYKMQVLPGAFTDFYNKTNDTINYRFETKNVSDYGNLRIKLENVNRFPVIVQLVEGKDGKVLEEKSTEVSNVNFDLIEPKLYTLRLIYDDNKNGVWDSGNFMEKRQSEEVIYFPKQIDVRANWDVEQPFDLRITN